jgi:hypothetical protein
MKALAVALCLLVTPACANPVYTIAANGSDFGGSTLRYISKYIAWADEKADVRIEGECDSSCTLVLGLVPLEHICATANAELGFHSATRDGVYSDAMTKIMWELYPERVIRLLTPLGLEVAQDHPNVVYIDAQKVVRPCGHRSE